MELIVEGRGTFLGKHQGRLRVMREQKTVTASHKQTTLVARGRHDPCVLPRAVPMVEAMTVLVLCDHALRQRAISVSETAARKPKP